MTQNLKNLEFFFRPKDYMNTKVSYGSSCQHRNLIFHPNFLMSVFCKVKLVSRKWAILPTA